MVCVAPGTARRSRGAPRVGYQPPLFGAAAVEAAASADAEAAFNVAEFEALARGARRQTGALRLYRRRRRWRPYRGDQPRLVRALRNPLATLRRCEPPRHERAGVRHTLVDAGVSVGRVEPARISSARRNGHRAGSRVAIRATCVESVLDIYPRELKQIMRQAGTPDIHAIDASRVVRKAYAKVFRVCSTPRQGDGTEGTGGRLS